MFRARQVCRVFRLDSALQGVECMLEPCDGVEYEEVEHVDAPSLLAKYGECPSDVFFADWFLG